MNPRAVTIAPPRPRHVWVSNSNYLTERGTRGTSRGARFLGCEPAAGFDGGAQHGEGRPHQKGLRRLTSSTGLPPDDKSKRPIETGRRHPSSSLTCRTSTSASSCPIAVAITRFVTAAKCS